MSFTYHSHVICMRLYFTYMYFYAIRLSVVYTRISSVCHFYILLCNGMSSVCTRMSSVCHSYVLSCHPYATRMYSYVIRMSSVCHLYVLRCHPYVTRTYLHVTRVSLVCSSTMNHGDIAKRPVFL